MGGGGQVGGRVEKWTERYESGDGMMKTPQRDSERLSYLYIHFFLGGGG
jgi:hypothetical protein